MSGHQVANCDRLLIMASESPFLIAHVATMACIIMFSVRTLYTFPLLALLLSLIIYPVDKDSPGGQRQSRYSDSHVLLIL